MNATSKLIRNSQADLKVMVCSTLPMAEDVSGEWRERLSELFEDYSSLAPGWLYRLVVVQARSFPTRNASGNEALRYIRAGKVQVPECAAQLAGSV
jgi:hypothetical protein